MVFTCDALPRNILNELRKALLGLYEAHRYFVVWLKDELFPSKSSAEELSILKSKHLEQKFAPMGGSPANMSALKSAPDSKDVATALINARRDWRAMHGESVSIDKGRYRWFSLLTLALPTIRRRTECIF